MKKEEKGEREEVMSKPAKPRWQYLFPISLPPNNGGNRNEEVNKTASGGEELNECMTATYWG